MKDEHIPTNPYEYMGYIHFQKNMMEFLLEELWKVLPRKEQARQDCENYARHCTDSGTGFVAEKIAVEGERDTDEAERLQVIRIGMAAGMEKARQEFIVYLHSLR